MPSHKQLSSQTFAGQSAPAFTAQKLGTSLSANASRPPLCRVESFTCLIPAKSRVKCLLSAPRLIAAYETRQRHPFLLQAGFCKAIFLRRIIEHSDLHCGSQCSIAVVRHRATVAPSPQEMSQHWPPGASPARTWPGSPKQSVVPAPGASPGPYPAAGKRIPPAPQDRPTTTSPPHLTAVSHSHAAPESARSR